MFVEEIDGASPRTTRRKSGIRRISPPPFRAKRDEWVRYHNTVSAWEVDQYLSV